MSILEIIAVLGALATGISAYLVGRMNDHSKRQMFYEDKITELLKIQSTEIRGLRLEVDRLISENQALTVEVSKLKYELEKRGVHYDNII